MTTDHDPAIFKEVKACRICEAQLPLVPRPIVQLHSKAKILIAGQAPGIRAHTSGIPFDDPSGNRLRQWLGVSKAQFYDETLFAILPMGFCYPGTGKSGDFAPLSRCAEKWRLALLQHLPNIRLTLAIGKHAQDWHIPQNKPQNLTQTVRSWRQYTPNILPLPHPSPRNNRWFKQHSWFESEVLPYLQQKVRQIIDN